MTTFYAILANTIAAFHAAYVFFVLFGLLYIVAGWILGWSSARNFWFRLIHLAMIAVVVAETVFNVQCPLTVWENDLVAMATKIDAPGSPDAAPSTAAPASEPATEPATSESAVPRFHERDFTGRLLHSLIHFDLPYNHWIFQAGYITFGALVLATFIFCPPRWPKREIPPSPANKATS